MKFTTGPSYFLSAMNIFMSCELTDDLQFRKLDQSLVFARHATSVIENFISFRNFYMYVQGVVQALSRRRTVTWRNTRKYINENFVAKCMFPVSSVEVFFLEPAVTMLHQFTPSDISCYNNVATLT
jgi:hypothetical protein